jgi:hypothetical protein
MLCTVFLPEHHVLAVMSVIYGLVSGKCMPERAVPASWPCLFSDDEGSRIAAAFFVCSPLGWGVMLKNIEL